MGARFRPQGRGPGDYDCVGVVLAAAEAAGIGLGAWDGYDWRHASAAMVRRGLRAAGLVMRDGAGVAGDVGWAAPGGSQHLVVRGEATVIEADATRRRVVERGLLPGDGACGWWRLPEGE